MLNVLDKRLVVLGVHSSTLLHEPSPLRYRSFSWRGNRFRWTFLAPPAECALAARSGLPTWSPHILLRMLFLSSSFIFLVISRSPVCQPFLAIVTLSANLGFRLGRILPFRF